MPRQHEVRLTKGAYADLDEITAYLEQQMGQDAVDEWLDAFEDKLSTLEQFPDRGAFTPELLDLGIRKYRQILLPPYRIIYQVLGTIVYIMIIAHGSRDFSSLLQRRLVRP